MVPIEGHGPLKLCVWASLESFSVSPGVPKGPGQGGPGGGGPGGGHHFAFFAHFTIFSRFFVGRPPELYKMSREPDCVFCTVVGKQNTQFTNTSPRKTRKNRKHVKIVLEKEKNGIFGVPGEGVRG